MAILRFWKCGYQAAGLNRWRISDHHGTSPSFVKLNTQDRVAVSLLTTLLITPHPPCTLNNALFETRCGRKKAQKAPAAGCCKKSPGWKNRNGAELAGMPVRLVANLFPLPRPKSTRSSP